MHVHSFLHKSNRIMKLSWESAPLLHPQATAVAWAGPCFKNCLQDLCAHVSMRSCTASANERNTRTLYEQRSSLFLENAAGAK